MEVGWVLAARGRDSHCLSWSLRQEHMDASCGEDRDRRACDMFEMTLLWRTLVMMKANWCHASISMCASTLRR